MTVTAQRKSALDANAEMILDVLREHGSVTREYVRQTCHIGSDSRLSQIMYRVEVMGMGAVGRTKYGALVWKPAPRKKRSLPFEDATPVPAAQEADRAKRRGEAWT